MSTINANYSFCKYNGTCAPNGLKRVSQKRDRKEDVGKALLIDVPRPNSPITVHAFPLPWPEVPTSAAYIVGKRAKAALMSEVAFWVREKRGAFPLRSWHEFARELEP